MDLASNNLQRLICHKTDQTTKQSKGIMLNKLVLDSNSKNYIYIYIYIFYLVVGKYHRNLFNIEAVTILAPS